MTVTADELSGADVPTPAPGAISAGAVAPSAVALSSLAFAGFASMGAGAIHAAAVGVHSEHRQASLVFVLTAAFQLAWGAWAVLRSNRIVALVGALGNAALVGGWILAKTRGISFVDGLEDKEKVQFADGLAAGLATLAALAVLAVLLDRRSSAQTGNASMLSIGGAVVAALVIPGMAAAGTHLHSHGTQTETATGSSTHTHGDEPPTSGAGSIDPASNGVATAQSAAPAETSATDGHNHAQGSDPAAPAQNAGGAPAPAPSAAPAATDTTVHAHGTPEVVPPKPYDPAKPIDLGGVPGVTQEEQARAENLVSATIRDLPQFADPTKLPALGWYSIGDSFSGYEHFVNWKTINDDTILDPNEPESIVFTVDRATGKKQLASAMFMLPDSVTLDQVPDIGGKLTQWHIHNNLCYSADPATTKEVKVIGITGADGKCRFGWQPPRQAPMIHVWIIPHKCGPFSALEGIGAGQVKAGETTQCDQAHGSDTP